MANNEENELHDPFADIDDDEDRRHWNDEAYDLSADK